MHEKQYPLVSDSHDPRFLALVSLQSFSGRSRSSLYIIEGIRHVARAVEERAPIQSFFLGPSRLSNHFGQRLAHRVRKSGLPGVRLSPRLYQQLTQAAEPQGIGAVVRQQWLSVTNIQPSRGSLWLALESIDSPGNLGSVIRTAEATGVNGIFMINSDPWHPATVRATMGSLFSQKLICCSAREFTEWAKASGVAIVGSSPAGLLDYRSLSLPRRRPAALVAGSEKQGLSETLREAADFMVRIPMLGRVDSINVAVATGVLLYEMFNQRAAPEHDRWPTTLKLLS